MTMLLALAELELDRIRENWSTAQQYAVNRGVHIASRAPTGYRRRDNGVLEPVKRDAAVIADVFRRRAAGASLSELARLLEQRKVRGPYQQDRETPHWTQSAVSKLLDNPVYTGEARSGKYRKPDAHQAIVTRDEWQAAQGSHSVTPLRSPDGALLSGILRCAGCRYVMKPDYSMKADGSKLRQYRCRGDHAAGRCPERATVSVHLIEPYVEQLFLDKLVRRGVRVHGEPQRKTFRRPG